MSVIFLDRNGYACGLDSVCIMFVIENLETDSTHYNNVILLYLIFIYFSHLITVYPGQSCKSVSTLSIVIHLYFFFTKLVIELELKESDNMMLETSL